MNTIERMKQLKFPKEFRIIPMGLDKEVFIKLMSLIEKLNIPNGDPHPLAGNDDQKNFFYAEVAVGVWRLKKKMIDPKNQQPLEEMSRAYRHLESILLTLQNEGVEIQDHDSQEFDSGLSINVLAFEPTPGIQKEVVKDTIKPSVYYKDERILMGEVIVGTPIIN